MFVFAFDGTGFLFDIPDRYTAESCDVPAPAEVAPWVETIIRLWDDSHFHAEAGRRCRERAKAWRPEVLLRRYKDALEHSLDGDAKYNVTIAERSLPQ